MVTEEMIKQATYLGGGIRRLEISGNSPITLRFARARWATLLKKVEGSPLLDQAQRAYDEAYENQGYLKDEESESDVVQG